MSAELTVTQLLAAATDVLTSSGYVGATMQGRNSSPASTSRVFEDPYGIVAAYIFESWNQLLDEWHLAQGELVDLMTETLSRPEPKAWEGYLILMTPGLMPIGERTIINEIRADTNRVRKLVAAGDELGTLDDIRTFLLPLVPLQMDSSLSGQAGLLESLPQLLKEHGVPSPVTDVVLQAFSENESIFQRLHTFGSNT